MQNHQLLTVGFDSYQKGHSYFINCEAHCRVFSEIVFTGGRGDTILPFYGDDSKCTGEFDFAEKISPFQGLFSVKKNNIDFSAASASSFSLWKGRIVVLCNFLGSIMWPGPLRHR